MLAWIVLLTLGGRAPATAGGEPYRVGSDVLLLCDSQHIEKMTGARLKMHSPQAREVAFKMGSPWENGIGGYATVIKDGGKYRMYYTAGGELAREYTCVVFSDDGIIWKKPSLGLFDYGGSKDNNIIWTGEKKAYCESHNFSPFIDANPACKPSERYKAVALKHMVVGDEKDSRRVLMGFVSPDGIHWKRLQEQPIITEGSFDSHNTAFWDAVRSEYVCYLRVGREGKRSIARSTSRDFTRWTKPEMLDFGNTPLEHLYTNGIEPYLRNPGIYLGFPMRFIPPKERDKVGREQRQTDGLSDMVFMSSYDGLRWNRQFMEAFVRPGLDQLNWGGAHGNSTPAWHVVQTADEELSIYWLEHFGHNVEPGGREEVVVAQFRRGTLRLDGFVSVNVPYSGGELVTRPIVFTGRELVLNLSTSAVGSVRVEIQDASGKPIAGFGLGDCKEIWGDEIARVVEWNDGSDIGKLSGRPLRLRFVMKDADLYSVRARP